MVPECMCSSSSQLTHHPTWLWNLKQTRRNKLGDPLWFLSCLACLFLFLHLWLCHPRVESSEAMPGGLTSSSRLHITLLCLGRRTNQDSLYSMSYSHNVGFFWKPNFVQSDILVFYPGLTSIQLKKIKFHGDKSRAILTEKHSSEFLGVWPPSFLFLYERTHQTPQSLIPIRSCSEEGEWEAPNHPPNRPTSGWLSWEVLVRLGPLCSRPV